MKSSIVLMNHLKYLILITIQINSYLKYFREFSNLKLDFHFHFFKGDIDKIL